MSRQRQTIVRSIVREATRRVPASRREAVTEFINAYFARVSSDDLRGGSPANFAGAALSHYELARDWSRGPRRIRVHNPDRKKDGWESPHTIVEIVTRNSPFLVDSVTMEIARQGYGTHLIIHPMLDIARDRRGRVTAVRMHRKDVDETGLVSLIHVEIDRETDAPRLAALAEGLERVLEDVRAAVRDWREIVTRVEDIIGELESRSLPLDRKTVSEGVEFLRWLLDDHFVFLGYRDYDLVKQKGGEALKVVPGSGLGILREQAGVTRSSAFAKLPPEIKRQASERTLLTLTKSQSRSTVHRPANLDYVGVRRYSAGGRVVGERRLLGLYTSRAYMSPPRMVPLVRRKIDAVFQRSGLMAGSHAGKALLNVLDRYPSDELLQASVDDLYTAAMGIVDLQDRQRVRLFIRVDSFERFCACLVFVPRDKFDSGVRRRIQSILMENLNGTSVEFETSISKSVYAQLYLTVHTTPGSIPKVDARDLEQRIADATRTWVDDLQAGLVEMYGEEWGNDLLRRYRDAFPAAYQEDHSAREACIDIRRIEAALTANSMQLAVYRDDDMPADRLMFKLYHPESGVALSAAIPILENMGLFVISQSPYEIDPDDAGTVWVHDFGMRREGGDVDVAAIKDKFQDAFADIWFGRVENDTLNRLVPAAQLSAREVTLLRAYSKYMRQIGTAFSQAYIEDTLYRHPEIARLLVELFQARFDPDADSKRRGRSSRLQRRIGTLLDAVASLDEDRILRRFYDLIRATLRTNFFQATAEGRPKEYMSFKFASRQIPDLDPPLPRFEVFVYSTRVEGVHLRGGKVARGGLRWSDRREDFRSEVLGLMKAQMVKNAVIVPVGAKGGFYVKRQVQGDRAARQAEGVECYRIFVRGLLDLTDNRAGEDIVHPPRVVRYDEDDSYLVVAADKGTATFSDIANKVAAEYGFWMGDAFASGGSEGYDHKKLGITARGAWESVKHHFQGLGLDPQRGDVTVVGIGDMGGDVFGNGMLLSKHIRLVGAFNHLHIFLDPDPDPARSFQERRRLFRSASGWGDYDSRLISSGGGVYPRSAKSIPLTAQVREMLKTDVNSATPSELIRLLLQAPVDLIWNGGIGTYVKAGNESHGDAADRGNDALRINAAQLRCKVIGEGGNLGITQRGRMEFAGRGGRINADWIDNSGGVHCSDREVNIKILLNAAVADGHLSMGDRNRLLRSMARDVSSLVLQDNYRQARAISAAEAESRRRIGWYGELLANLDSLEDFSREREFLPGNAELERRRVQQQGMSRPELAVLLAYTKTALYQAILRSGLPDDPYMAGMLERYFPEPVRERFSDRIATHQLRREIIATVVTSSMVNRAGVTFGHRLADESGARVAEITRAYLISRDVFGIVPIWDQIDRLDHKVSLEAQLHLVFEVQHLLRHAARWFLRRSEYLADIAGTVERFRAGVGAVESIMDRRGNSPEHAFIQRFADGLHAPGVPAALTHRVAALRLLVVAPEITNLAAAAPGSLERVARTFLVVGRRLKMTEFHGYASALVSDNIWQDRARTGVFQDLLALQGSLTAGALAGGGSTDDPEALVDRWLGERGVEMQRFEEVFQDLRDAEQVDLSMLSVAMGKLRLMLGPV